MKLELAAVAVALVLVATGAAAAMPGNAPDHAQGDDHANDNAENAPEKADDEAGDTDDDAHETADDDAHDADENATESEDGSESDDGEADETDESDADETNESQGPPADVPAAAQSGAADGNETAAHGPPADLPAPVPDFVPSIHDAIQRHVDGSLPGSELGQAISDLVAGGAGDANANTNAAQDGQ